PGDRAQHGAGRRPALRTTTHRRRRAAPARPAAGRARERGSPHVTEQNQPTGPQHPPEPPLPAPHPDAVFQPGYQPEPAPQPERAPRLDPAPPVVPTHTVPQAAGQGAPTPSAELRDALAKLRLEVAKAVVGQDAAVSGLVIALLCRGHVLLEGVPGVAKTLLVRTLS